MKAKTLQRIVAAAMAFVMVLLMVPVTPMEATAVTTTYTLDSSADLTEMAAGDKADGDTEVINGYFTIHYSEKTKIDGSSKTWEDGYSGTQRLNLGGKAQVGSTIKNCVEFTTSDKAVIKVWFVQGGDDDRQVGILDADKNVVTQSNLTGMAKNSPYYCELAVDAAGTYYLGGVTNNNNLYKIVVEEGAELSATPEETTAATTAATEVTEPVGTPDYDPSKIDVWDFGAEQLDASKYNNMLNVDEINSWFPGIEPGTSGTPLLGFTSTDGQLKFEANGKTNNRLRTTNTALCRHDDKSLTDANGVTYTGYIYSNSPSTSAVYVGLQVNAGDILTVVVGSNGGDSDINFEGPNGVEDVQTFLASGAKAQIMKFYPAESGMYKFYSTNEKLVIARIYREHTSKVPVSGTVTAPAELTDYSIRFTNQSNGSVVDAPVSGGAYSAQLNEGFTYDVSLVNANGYIITSEQTLEVAKDAASASLDINVIQVDLVTVTGNITGLSEEALAAMTLAFEADTIYVPEITVSGSTYSVKLETGVTYQVAVYGINDYELTSAASVFYEADSAADITLAAKPTYAITIEPTGATLADLAGATFTFTNLNEEGYVYTFTGTDSIALRDGTYSVKVANSGIYVQQLTSNLKVDGAATTKKIPFSSDITVWDFSAEDFTGTSPYNGLAFSNASKNKTYLLSNAGTISVPVKGACQIKVSACYKYSFESDDAASQDANTGSTSQIDTFTITYTGDAGTATINVLGQSYITKIEVVEVVPFQSTITVGASGCDYTTIGAALDAVRGMERPSNERVTIMIQPGNYEEQLVIDVANVTLKNASSSPSIELKNKGVDIDANAVRITHYYGCGYNYFSMDNNCKYDENILAVNKENGYTDFVNPGDGSGSDSYWNATVIVKANGFQAEDIIFENSFNQYVSEKAANDVIVPNGECKEGSVTRGDLPVGSTAVQNKAYVERAAALAIVDNVSKVYFDGCKFVGRQDTLYGGKNVTAAFYGCSIYGAVDYIFGGMTAVFAKCDLVFNTSEDGNDVGYITAAQTPSGNHGYLMYNCNVTSTTPGVDTASEYTSKPGYFGRPWAASTGEAVFYMTVIDAADTHWYTTSPSLIRDVAWLSTLSGESALCGEYGTYEYAKDVDNSAKRAAWATVFETETLANGEPIAVETWLGDWDPFAGKDMTITMPTDKVDNKPVEEEETPAAGATYVLDTTLDLQAMVAGAKADGETETFKDYFTIMYSAKNKIDSSNKTFDDGYTATQRLNFGGKTDPANGMLNSIQFETANSATVKIWWVSGGDGRQFAIYDNGGTVLSTTEEEAIKNSLYISELRVDEAGTYYLGVPDGSNYLFKMEVTEDAPAGVAKEYILDTTLDLQAMVQGAKADGETETFKDYFTIMYSAKNKIDSSSKTFDDGYTATQRLNFGGKTDPANGMINSVKFTTANAATVKIWWVSGGDGRQMAIYDDAGNILSKTEDEAIKNSLYISELSVDRAGTYYLGVPDGSNYLFKLHVTEAASSAVQEFVLDATEDLPAMAQGDKADGDTETFKDFFTIMYSAKNKIDSSSKTFDDGYSGTQRLNFGGKTLPSSGMINSVKFTTTDKATVKIWWVSGGDGRQFGLYNGEGTLLFETKEESIKNELYITEMEIEEAGTYYLGVPTGSNYLFKLQVIVGGGEATIVRGDWDKVEAPAVTAATDDGEGNIEVTVSGVVGSNGGDELVVTMYDAEGNEVASKRSIAEKGEHTLKFAPTASGNYTFKAVLSREGEEAKVSEEFVGSFILPLGTPYISSATSAGDGGISVIWTAVDEATAYNVYVDGELAGTVPAEYTELLLVGFEIGQKYSFQVSAVRGEEESAKSAAAECTATKNAQQVWSFSAYGASTNTTSNGYVGSLNEDGKVTVFSEGGKGKIVPASCDGVAFYYTTVPTEYNFTLRATVTVDSWTLSNGQEGFGLMAADRVAEHGDTNSQYWNNSVMALASKIEYRYDADTDKYYDQSASYMGVKYSMKLGLGTIVRSGATWDGINNANGGVPEGFVSVSDTLDNTPKYREAGTYNIVGNATAEVSGTIAEMTTFDLEIQKNNTGYFVSYYNAKTGKLIKQIKYYGADMLNQLDSENVYVGFFAARNARITVEDVQFSTILASEDAPAEERPITYIEPTLSIVSAATSNTAEYTVSFSSNVAGTADVSINGEIVATGIPVVADIRSDCDVVLPKASYNTLRVYFYPDPDQDLGEYTELSSTDRLYKYMYVRYNDRFEDLTNLYVSPSGSYINLGTKDSPLDIYTAVSVVQPGQTIILMDGTYRLRDGIKIPHGSDGTAETPIRMIADPEAKSRPVLNFRGLGNGITHGGDYWYFQGFDVTNTAEGQKGFQISGHYNVVDNVNTYNNGNTGLQISRFAGSDPQSDWPSNNLILNCTSYNNADPGYEDADGFAAKLTCGEGNVFDGCVAYNNADDGWDMYAKVETGPIGAVTVRNCVAYENGYVIENGVLVNAGNGNGFKMGGESIPGKHKLINSIAFNNKAKGIDSNSCPDIIVENCISYNNESHNVAFYTNNAANTDFSATGIISFKDSNVKSGYETGENLKPKGTQDTSKYLGTTNYYWDGTGSTNSASVQVTADWFKSLEFKGVARNADGTINMQGFLELTELADENVNATIGGTPSGAVTVNPEPGPEGDPSNPSTGDNSMPMLLALVMMISAAGVAVVCFNRKRFF